MSAIVTYPTTDNLWADSPKITLDKILQAYNGGAGGGGSGGGDQQVYTGAAPPAAPDNPALPAVFYPTGGGALLQWDGAAWI